MTLISIIIMMLLSIKGRERNVFTWVFLVVMFFFAGCTFYFSGINNEYEIIAILSITIIWAFSFKIIGSRKRDLNNAKYIQGFGNLSKDRLFFGVGLLGFALFLMPMLDGNGLPLYHLMTGEMIVADEMREYYTKVVWYSSILMFILYFSLLTNFVYWGARWRCINKLKKIQIVSLVYAQKLNPFILIGGFYIGWIYVNSLNIKMLLMFAAGFLGLLLLVGYLFAGADLATTFFMDMILRRLGEVPAKVYVAYIEYGRLNPIQLLNGNFTFVTGNVPLPVSVYHFMEYGHGELGWANGLYVGDLYVNFGIYGMLLISMLIGVFLRWCNFRFTMIKNGWGLILFSSVIAFNFFLGSNALFSGIVFLVIFLIYFSAIFSVVKIKI